MDNYIDNFLPHFPDIEDGKEYIYKYHEEDYNNYDGDEDEDEDEQPEEEI